MAKLEGRSRVEGVRKRLGRVEKDKGLSLSDIGVHILSLYVCPPIWKKHSILTSDLWSLFQVDSLRELQLCVQKMLCLPSQPVSQCVATFILSLHL